MRERYGAPSNILTRNEGTPAQNTIERKRARMIITELLQTAKLFHILYTFDKQLANDIKDKRCPFCGGILDWGNYQRKPRGQLCNVPDEYLVQFSLCCRNEHCRRRTKPPSCRFWGRKVYWSCVIIVIMALVQNRSKKQRIKQLQDLFDISHHTIRRWLRFFKDHFPFTDQWKRLRGKVISTIKDSQLPSNLLNYFIDTSPSKDDGLIRCLQFLASGHL